MTNSNSAPEPTVRRRDFLRGSLGLGAAAALAGCGFSGDTPAPAASTSPSGSAAPSESPAAKAVIDGDLVYFNWAEYIEPTVLEGFKKEYGVKVIETNYDTYPGMLAKMSSGNQYDVVLPGARFVEQLRNQNMIQRIDKAQLKNANQSFGWGSYFDNPWYDPNSDYSIPFSMYTTGIAYRKDKITTMTGSWADLWNEEGKGHIYVLDEADEAIGMAALLLGLDVNTANPDDLAKIKDKLISQKPYLRAYSTDDINNLAGGNAWIHQEWSGDFLNFINYTAEDPKIWEYIAPKEGMPVNSDAWVIPANAPHPGTALVFLDYLLRPENIIKNIEYLGYPLLAQGGEATYAKMVEGRPSLAIDLKNIDDTKVYRNHTPADTAARDTVWTEVKAS